MGGGKGKGLDFGATYGSGQLALVFETPEPETLRQPNFQIGRSLGAAALNYDIKGPDGKKIYHFLEGSTISNIEVFAGKGVRKKLRPQVTHGLVAEHGGKARNWKHVKGIGTIDCGYRVRTAEVHWFEETSVGKVGFKIKKWRD